ncbi:MAG: chromosomal replication initiator protein DnaA [Bacteroidetes bacterium]|nr:chromosomal replication initiator protein DnaA [Bacteroidia bacterium]PCH69616.1 MAG: chromosomal replication initiator protein DnaA [Bacteroidota bacterium]
MSQSAQSVWTSCLDVINDNVNPQSFKTWFNPIEPVKLEKDVLTIQVPSMFFYEWLEEHYVDLLSKTIKKFLGIEARLEYSIILERADASGNGSTVNVPTLANKDSQNPSVAMPVSIGPEIPNPFVIPGLKKIKIDPQLNQNYTFNNFIEGECNSLARSAGFAVANKPGQTAFNPLMLYGGVGLGKTHLAQAIGNKIKELYKDQYIVLYVQSEKFSNQFVDAIKNNSKNDFFNFYQLVDVLILDDVQFLSSKHKTQDILFHLFNHLHQAGKQLIFTSDRHPKDIDGMDDRLLSRFKWGLSCDLQPPDLETRIAILGKKTYMDGISVPKEIIEYIAHNIDSNVRELEGALISLMAQSSLNKKEIDLNLAKQIIKNFVRNITREVSIDYIQKLVCDFYEMPIDIIKAKSRKREIVQTRQIAMFLSKAHTKSSLKNIGKHFGGKDHSTVIHACNTIDNLMQIDKKLRGEVDALQKKIKISMT